jgi:hypothetical protein
LRGIAQGTARFHAMAWALITLASSFLAGL